MFAREHRLRHEKDIKALFAKGKSVFGFYIGLRFRKNPLDISRFTVVVGTKVSKRAVVRNKIKRRLRAAVLKEIEHIAPGYDVIVLVKKQAVDVGFDALKQDLEHVLKRAKLLV